MTLATAIIPVSPQHYEQKIYRDAVASVESQTVPTDALIVIDTEGKGAAWARNQGAQLAPSPFLIFLDADDLLDPRFVEATVKGYQQGAYVYTNYIVDSRLRKPPAVLNSAAKGQQHVTTTLLPKTAWQAVGGFDETLPTLEDEDFYRKLHAYGWRWRYVPEPLITYRRSLGFGKVNRERHDVDIVQKRIDQAKQLFAKRYNGRFDLAMCDCRPPDLGAYVTPERRPNDVLAEALYPPQFTSGPITGRRYPRAGKIGNDAGDVLWVDKDDVETAPHLWRKVADNPIHTKPSVNEIWRILSEQQKRKSVALNQPAEAPKPVAEKKVTKATAPKPVKVGYDLMTYRELQALVKERQLTHGHNPNKAKLIQLLQESDKANERV